MICLPARFVLAASAALALAVPLAAQQNPGTFSLPPPRPAPTPAPAGPNDELAGVPIPPRAVPRTAPTPRPTATPTPLPTAAPRPQPTTAPSAALPAPVRTAPAPSGERLGTVLAPAPTVPAPTTAPAPLPTASGDPLALPPSIPGTLRKASPVAASPPAANSDAIVAPPAWELPAWELPAWELIAAGGVGALAVLGAGLLVWRRRKPKVLRLASPLAAGAAAARGAERAPDLSDLHLSLDITTATRSLMMFTVGYRLNIANRSGRAVCDMRIAVQLVCARASANPPRANVPCVGAAQTLSDAPRIGPHQARTITGEVQLALSAIQPLRQGTTALFVPLIHVTIEGDGQPALTRTFVIGTPSSSGRVHPIQLNHPPGGIAGLVAQAVAVPSASAAA